MKRIVSVVFLGIVLCGPTASGQSTPPGFRAEFLGHLNYSGNRLLALAEATPEALFAWRPNDAVMSIEQVYTHIARYNYYYPESSLGIPAPEGVQVETMEEITGKAQVVDVLRRSLEHVRQAVEQMPEERLSEEARLYGRQVAGWSVLFQLLAHMNEHVGQSISYARMNGIVPPWSQAP
jgi:uncharacterized damage-inducible protein DinB